jgi:hypothetical protein
MRHGPVFITLVHHPVRGRDGAIITTSVTNLDVHDIARTARTYDLAGYYVVTPIEAQRALVGHILGYWREGDGGRRVPERNEALSRVQTVATVDEALRAVGEQPLMITTAARSGFGAVSFADARARIDAAAPRPVVLLFGTGYGLADELIRRAEIHLAPIRPGGDYNHLAVRSAAAIIVDRLFGDEGAGTRAG